MRLPAVAASEHTASHAHAMNAPLAIVSSMATRQVLSELVLGYEGRAGQPVVLSAMGGVDAVKRLRADEAFDVAILASDAIDQLAGEGRLVADSRMDLVRSGVAIAVRAGAPRPSIATEDDVRRAVQDAHKIGHSTGPSGVALAKLFERWGIAGAIADRIVQAPPGVPVGTLLLRGDVDLGFQQLSELRDLPGIDVLGPLPASIQIVTTFSGAVTATSARPDAGRALLACLASPAADDAKRRHGMAPARPSRDAEAPDMPNRHSC